jgi:rSAM/selenodomain-associated transferase 2
MISVIIPVYNEEKSIRDLLNSFCYSNELEIIVADGASIDQTVELAQNYPVRIVKTIKNRSNQMNEAARIAKGDILVFLHADCRLEEESLEEIRDISHKGYVGGCLTQRIDSDKLIYRVIETSGNIRAKLLKVFYGDQAIFVKRDAFFKVDGYDDVELFDDIMFSRKLKKLGDTCVLKSRVYTSARRWERQGIIKTTLINWILTLGFLLGISHRNLKQIYHDVR